MDIFSIPCIVYEQDGSTLLETTEAVDLSPWGVSTTIPARFVSDGMSVPRFFWRFIGPPVDGRTMSPSIAHDWLYACQVLPRAQADKWYRLMLIAGGYPKRKAWLAWAAIRLFGGSHWAELPEEEA